MIYYSHHFTKHRSNLHFSRAEFQNYLTKSPFRHFQVEKEAHKLYNQKEIKQQGEAHLKKEVATRHFYTEGRKPVRPRDSKTGSFVPPAL